MVRSDRSSIQDIWDAMHENIHGEKLCRFFTFGKRPITFGNYTVKLKYAWFSKGERCFGDGALENTLHKIMYFRKTYPM